MISIQQDPQNPDRLTLTVAVTLYLDRLMDTVISDEVSKAISEQVIKDLSKRGVVRKAIQAAASQQLPAYLEAGATATIKTVQQETHPETK